MRLSRRPYGRRRIVRRRPYSRRRTGSVRFKKTRTLAKIALRSTKKLKRRTEVKLLVKNYDTEKIAATGLTYDAKGPADGKGVLYNNFFIDTANPLQGIEGNQRIGLVVAPLSLRLKIMVHALPWHKTTNPSLAPFEVWMVVYRHKLDWQSGTRLNPSSNNPSTIKRLLGDSGVPSECYSPLDGTWKTVSAPFNTDQYTILKHKRLGRFRAQPAHTYTSAATVDINSRPVKSLLTGVVGPATTAQLDTNAQEVYNPQTSGGSFYKKCSFKMPISKNKLRYTPGDATDALPFYQPVGYKNYAVGFYVLQGDDSELGLTCKRAAITCQSQFRYSDA